MDELIHMPTKAALLTDLQSRLVSGEFESGQRLQLEQFSRDYDVSPVTIRLLLIGLSEVGLVDWVAESKFCIPLQSSGLLDDLTQTRMLFETKGVCLSMRYSTVDWRDKLSVACDELTQVESQIHMNTSSPELIRSLIEKEINFHCTLLEACRSASLRDLHYQVCYRFWQQLVGCDKATLFLAKNIEQHRSILDSVFDNDAVSAQEQIVKYLSSGLK